MNTLLQINSSLSAGAGQSSRLASAFVERWRAAHPGATTLVRDLARDTQTAYVRQFLGFLGIEEVEFVYAEGLAIDEASRQGALQRAHERIERLAEPLQAAA
jgi:FMN-dependent NADH-azoreductase